LNFATVTEAVCPSSVLTSFTGRDAGSGFVMTKKQNGLIEGGTNKQITMTQPTEMKKITIVGSGLIGRSWAMVIFQN
jgi:hypothetical protein